MASKKNAPYGPLRSGLTQMRTASVMDPDAPDEARRAEMRGLLDIISAIPGIEAAPLKALAGAKALPVLAGVVKPKGGNRWLTGSVEDALRGLKKQGYNDVNPEVDSLNRFIEGPLTKYVKTRMASPEDEVRRLAEQGVLHYQPQWGLTDRVIKAREAGGFPVEGLGKSDLARNWETMSDRNLRRDLGRDLSAAERDALMGGKTVPPDTVIYSVRDRDSAADLGFPHLIDELSNALNPASGLPRHLQLSPEAMQHMSMEKAVRRVADINAWRAAQKAETNRKLAEQAMMVRDYPENNPMGLKWVELKAPEGYGVASFEAVEKGDRELFKKLKADDDIARQALADQLKYEGDVMGHCVGGYCDDVLSGRSRIFSLRDAKGEPHVTVEVSPQPRNYGQQDIPDRYVEDAMERLGIDSPEGQWGREEEIDRLAGDLFKKDNPDTNRIVQIKGKQNRAPNPEYLPFVQDFVRNSPLGSPWSDVGDLGNTGLISARDQDAMVRAVLLGKPIGIDEGYAAAKRIGERQPYYTQSELLEAFKNEFPDKFASGGAVEAGNPATVPSWNILSAL